MGFVPVLHGLHRRSAPRGGLWQLRAVEMDIAHQGLLQVKGAVEVVALQHLLDPSVEALDHAIGLGVLRRGQAVFDPEVAAELVELVLAGRCPAGDCARVSVVARSCAVCERSSKLSRRFPAIDGVERHPMALRQNRSRLVADRDLSPDRRGRRCVLVKR